jgi:hypothetical protein
MSLDLLLTIQQRWLATAEGPSFDGSGAAMGWRFSHGRLFHVKTPSREGEFSLP